MKKRTDTHRRLDFLKLGYFLSFSRFTVLLSAIVALSFLFSFLFSLPTLAGPDGLASCGDTINVSTTLTSDLLNCAGDGLIITADNVMLDCQGHTISGSGAAVGIKAYRVMGVNANITVRNCLISDFGDGIHIAGVSPSLITNNTIVRNSGSGIELTSLSFASVTSNVLEENSLGINLEAVYGPTAISANTIRKNGDGMRWFIVRNISIFSNIFNAHNYNGIWDYGYASGNLIYNNFFNSSYVSARAPELNYWNTTKTPGTNIVGGPYLGGNFWGDYKGKDINRDGIGDTLIPYTAGGNIKEGDFLPLVPLRLPKKDPMPKIGGCVPPPQSMIAWWPGDGNAKDRIGNNQGILQNGANFSAGMVAQAFNFDGVDDFVSTTNPLVITNSRITIDAWIYPKRVSSFHKILKVHNAPSGWRDVWIEVAQNKASFVIYDTSGTAHQVDSSSTLNPNTWYHVAGTYDGSVQGLYVDGVLEGTASWSGSFDFNDTGFIGRDQGNNHHFNGSIDEVEIFNRSLSASEIQAIVAAGGAGKCK